MKYHIHVVVYFDVYKRWANLSSWRRH